MKKRLLISLITVALLLLAAALPVLHNAAGINGNNTPEIRSASSETGGYPHGLISGEFAARTDDAKVDRHSVNRELIKRCLSSKHRIFIDISFQTLQDDRGFASLESTIRSDDTIISTHYHGRFTGLSPPPLS
jgi:hypothetical protein